MYFLDTNTCIYFLNGKFTMIRERNLSTPPYQIAIPDIVKTELMLGAYKSQKKQRISKIPERFLNLIEIVSFSDLISYNL